MSENATAEAFTRTFTDSTNTELVLEGSSVATKCAAGYTSITYYDGSQYHLTDQSSTCTVSGAWNTVWHDDMCVYCKYQCFHSVNSSCHTKTVSPSFRLYTAELQW